MSKKHVARMKNVLAYAGYMFFTQVPQLPSHTFLLANSINSQKFEDTDKRTVKLNHTLKICKCLNNYC